MIYRAHFCLYLVRHYSK